MLDNFHGLHKRLFRVSLSALFRFKGVVVNEQDHYRRLLERLRVLDGLVVAFSGGVDSSLLLAAAVDALGERALAVTGDSPSVPRRELELAGETARELGARHLVVPTCELEDSRYAANPPDRCFHCKRHLFDVLWRVAEEQGLKNVAEGSNADDAADYRPGARAVVEAGVLSPLKELGFGKEAVRALARWRGLSVWQKPAAACLSSRVPYGSAITAERLRRIERAEEFLLGLGFSRVRVRDHDGVARIETEPGQIVRLLADGLRARVSTRLRELGFRHVTVDLDGYRTGSLNLPSLVSR